MSKPKTIPVAEAGDSRRNQKQRQREDHAGQEPLSGSKKVKQANHVDHHNPQG